MADSISTWESPRTSDWDKTSVHGQRECVANNQFVTSDESSFEVVESECSGRTEEYFASFGNQPANVNVVTPSFNNNEVNLTNEMNKLLLSESECTNVDILTPKSETSLTVSQEEIEADKTEAEVRDEANNNVETKEGTVVESEEESTARTEESNDKSTTSTDDNTSTKKLVLNKKIEWTPRGSQPRYMNKSEEMMKKIEAARQKAAKDTSKTNANLNRDKASSLEDVRQRIAANNKAEAERKAAIVQKEKQRVADAARARREAKEKYIQEARQKAEVNRVVKPRTARVTA